MPVNLLAISVGNTRTRLGLFFDNKPIEDDALDNARFDRLTARVQELWNQVKELPDAMILMASVNPPLAERLESFVQEQIKDARFARCERDIDIPIGRQLDPEAIVGEDRLLNAAAAYDVLKQACVIVDAGTAITVNFVDGAGTFHGGAIAPGASMMLAALHEHTAQLPETTPARPIDAIGHNTVEAMRSGMFHGLRGLVHELTEQFAQIAGAFPLVVVTGGDAAMIFEGDERIDRIVPNLTLLGMAATIRHAMEE